MTISQGMSHVYRNWLRVLLRTLITALREHNVGTAGDALFMCTIGSLSCQNICNPLLCWSPGKTNLLLVHVDKASTTHTTQ